MDPRSVHASSYVSSLEVAQHCHVPPVEVARVAADWDGRTDSVGGAALSESRVIRAGIDDPHGNRRRGEGGTPLAGVAARRQSQARVLYTVWTGDAVRLGVVLFQLGGPDSLEAIEPFLYNLFCDPDIIDFPFARIARQPLARLIASRRAKHVAGHYRKIGGRSPILDYTTRQANALECALRPDFDVRVAIAMRYWHPMTGAAIREIQRHSPDELVLLPLYPQYSRTTTGSSLKEWARCFDPHDFHARVHVVKEFYEHPPYIESVVAAINVELAGFADPAETDFVFSAHGIPAAVVEQGDPYQRQIERTAELVWGRGGWGGRRHLCYQSKVGASRWLAPSLHESIVRLAEERRRNLLIVPISFVSDHVETLYEVDIEHRAQALSLGIPRFHMVPGLNDSPAFIEALAGLVRAQIAAG